MTIGCSPRLKTKTRSRESVATPATSTRRHPSGRPSQAGRTSKRRPPRPDPGTGLMRQAPARCALSRPGDVVPDRVESDPIQALVDGDVEHVLLVADAEVAVARVARQL